MAEPNCFETIQASYTDPRQRVKFIETLVAADAFFNMTLFFMQTQTLDPVDSYLAINMSGSFLALCLLGKSLYHVFVQKSEDSLPKTTLAHLNEHASHALLAAIVALSIAGIAKHPDMVVNYGFMALCATLIGACRLGNYLARHRLALRVLRQEAFAQTHPGYVPLSPNEGREIFCP